MGGNHRSSGNRVTVLRVTNFWRLRNWGGSRLGAHTNLNRVRKGCVCVKNGIIVAIMERMFISNRQVDEASVGIRAIQTRGSPSVRGASARENPYIRTSGVRSATSLN